MALLREEEREYMSYREGGRKSGGEEVAERSEYNVLVY